MINSAILFLTFFLFGSQHGTAYQSFTIDEKEVVWAQVYNDESSAAGLSSKMYGQLRTRAWIRNAHYEGDEILADIENFRIDYKRYGARYMKTSNIIRTGRWSGKLRIMFREGRYRVIVYGLHYVARQPARTAGKMSMEAHDIFGTLTDFALTDFRTEFRKSRLASLDIMHMNLKDLFVFNSKHLADQEW